MFPTNNIIVRQGYYNRDNNEVVEFSVLHQDMRKFMFLRKSVCLMRCEFGRRAVPRFITAKMLQGMTHKAWEARATSGSTILTI